MCGGDFNEFLWDYEKDGGAEVLYNRIRYLEEFMNSTGLVDLDFHGPVFTWRGMRNRALVEEMIDRVLVNGLWQDKWPNSTVLHGTVLGSDHCSFIFQSQLERFSGRKLFRSEAFWAKDEECKNLVGSC